MGLEILDVIQKPSWMDWLTLVALFLGPTVALMLQRELDRLREKKAQMFNLYMTLMRTRATPLAVDHVNAVNAIDVIFHEPRYKNIQNAWMNVKDHLNPAKTDLTRGDAQRP